MRYSVTAFENDSIGSVASAMALVAAALSMTRAPSAYARAV